MNKQKTIIVAAILALVLVAAAPVLQETNFTNLGLGEGSALDTWLKFDGNAQDFYVALDDSADDLLIGLGSTVGTTPIISMDENRDTTLGGDLTMAASTLALGDSNITQDVGVENVGILPSVVTTAITYTAAAGGSGTVATVTDGEIWLVHSVFISVTTNFDATGDDVTFVIGDGNDADGFLVAADANLQTTFTEATGYQAGWYGLENGSNGAYTVDEGLFLYAPSGADETIDWLLDETSGETITAGAATIYVIYTRLQ